MNEQISKLQIIVNEHNYINPTEIAKIVRNAKCRKKINSINLSVSTSIFKKLKKKFYCMNVINNKCNYYTIVILKIFKILRNG